MNKRISKKLDNINSVTLKPLFRRVAGWKDIEEKIDTIHYFLNNFLDITKLPPTTGLLRKVQLADTELLRIIADILTKNGLRYWLDYGTLLGAVRHKGFIPWDDDLDIAMPRTDFEKAIMILPAILDSYDVGCKIAYGQSSPGRFWVNIWNAGLILDIVAFDSVSADSYYSLDDLQKKLLECRKYYVKYPNKTFEEYKEKREELIGCYSEENAIWFHNPEYDRDFSTYRDSAIFPLNELEFEGYKFFCPRNHDVYLSAWYGDYMQLPKSGILHHKGSGNGVHNNSSKHKVDMDRLIESLKSIHPLED